MRIALTGTPGTGKTSIAAALGAELGMQVLAVNDLVEGMNTEQDPERDATMVEPGGLRAAFEEADIPEDVILEGHLAHHLPVDVTVVLRCHPAELEERLEEKDWGEAKVRENVEAEALDVVLGEAIQEQEQVVEVDTTGRNADAAAQEIAGILKKDAYKSHAPGHVSWDLDEVFD